MCTAIFNFVLVLCAVIVVEVVEMRCETVLITNFYMAVLMCYDVVVPI